MDKFVFRNGRILPLGEVRLSPGQAGLLNGWGLFTTMRIYDGVPFAFERHWSRLTRDAERIQLPLTHTADVVRRALDEVVRANHAQSGCARIYFVFNKIGIWGSDEPFPAVDLIIYSAPLPARVGPTQLAVMPHGRHAQNPLTGTKVTSWLNNVWHLEQAHRRGFDDAILLNERGEVAECTAANLFQVDGETISTPPSSAGCLLGVTREILLEQAPKHGLKMKERPLTVEELYRADEVFITSTTRAVQAIRRIESTDIRHAPGPITERLTRIFSDYVQNYTSRAVGAAAAAREQ